MDSIFELEHYINKLKKDDENSYRLFNSIYSFYSEIGTMEMVSSIEQFALNNFGKKDASGNVIESVHEVFDKLENQRIVNIFNEWTCQGTLYNRLRSKRPGMSRDLTKEKAKLQILINNSRRNCDFCGPETKTPKDQFGRVRGKHSTTAANIAKYDVYSSLVIFKEHNPLEFNLEEFSDYIETSFKWFELVFKNDEKYCFPFFVWNCLPRAGASLIHGHAQILMTKDRPYARVESLRRACKNYKHHTTKEYFDDIYRIHKSIGLSHEYGDVKLFASITPVKEKEITIISKKSPSTNEQTKRIIFKTLRCLIDTLGVQSFNMSISCPSMKRQDNFPYIIQIVDRGDISKSTADIGGMELFGSTVVSDDPYSIIKKIRECL